MTTERYSRDLILRLIPGVIVGDLVGVEARYEARFAGREEAWS
jgi:uncharacterized membrane protein YhiD involved in acid resistance